MVDHWCHSGKTAGQVAKEFGVKVWNVRDWRRQHAPTHKPVSAQCEAGNARLVRVPWNGDFLREIEGSPVAHHDDQVGALSGARGMLSTSTGAWSIEDLHACISGLHMPAMDANPDDWPELDSTGAFETELTTH